MVEGTLKGDLAHGRAGDTVAAPAGGAIHCITKEVGVDQPLLITHFRPERPEANASITFDIDADHISGIAEATMHYSVDGAPYQAAGMDYVSESNWRYFMPGQEAGTVIRYYFQVTSNSGKTIFRPLPAPEGYFSIDVDQSTVSARELKNINDVHSRVFPNPASALMSRIGVPFGGTCLDKDTHRLGESGAPLPAGDAPLGELHFTVHMSPA